MIIKEVKAEAEIIAELISLSESWENEDITYGYRKNSEQYIKENRIFLAVEKQEIIGYLFGHKEIAQRDTPIYQNGEEYFEVEELYIKPAFRNKGIGTKLFQYVEQTIKNEVKLIMLGTATKNYRSILHFYIDEIGMSFWSAALFKRIS